jgi:hypothetical protein
MCLRTSFLRAKNGLSGNRFSPVLDKVAIVRPGSKADRGVIRPEMRAKEL